MEKELSISFLLPCYNVAKYVEECIESIMRQELENFEIICVDDCSTDDTYSVLCELSRHNANIKVLKNKENQGVSYTRNVALKAAQGEYIWFVDPDDLLYPGAAKQLAKVAASGVDYVAGNYLEYDDSFSLKDLDALPIFDHSASVEGGEDFVPVCTNQNGAIAGSVCLGIRRRKFLINNNLFFNEKVHMTEDVLFNFLCEQHPRSCMKIEANVYIYRVHEHSATTEKTSSKIEKTVASEIELIKIYTSFKGKDNAKDVQKIENRILFLREDCLLNLTKIRNRATVKYYLNELKSIGLYPWRRKINGGKGLRALNANLIGHPIVFWFNHFLRALFKKNY